MGPDPQLGHHKNIGFISNTTPIKNHKATKPAVNVGTSSARQRNANGVSPDWRFAGGPMMTRFKL